MYHKLGKIGVIFGGLSSEREISLKSGKAVLAALLEGGFNAQAVDLKTEEPQEVADIIKNSGIDVAFIAMHGRFGEDGKLQAILEKLNVPFVGSGSLSSALAIDKIASMRVFKENNIPVPRCEILNIRKKDNLDKSRLSFPLVVKPQAQGSSIGVSFVKNIRELDKALDLAFQYDKNVILQEYIDGKELTVGILDNCALEPIEISPKNKFFDFQAKYNKGMTEYILPASVDGNSRNQAQSLALKSHQALGCRHFSRVDLMLDKEGNPFILEINTIPGFTSTSLLPKAALYQGITFVDLCLKLLTLATNGSITILKK
ncbi:MAG: D-alanine--D-alanine ligase [Candidatus Omnitrophica bacterium]|nr:D-alanine--D-alanine ligase [Candidatus Omnitrophota bacterium]MDD5355244.1 D-alanine--D-alanine ligase [Candidatus Omnitrophota bacterium]